MRVFSFRYPEAGIDELKKDDLSAEDISSIKAVAVDLLKVQKAEKLCVDNWRDKEPTRYAVNQTIHEILYSEETGLPVDLYEEDEVVTLACEVFRHLFRAYPEIPSPVYGSGWRLELFP